MLPHSKPMSLCLLILDLRVKLEVKPESAWSRSENECCAKRTLHEYTGSSGTNRPIAKVAILQESTTTAPLRQYCSAESRRHTGPHAHVLDIVESSLYTLYRQHKKDARTSG